jgi:hypothetical protein
VSWYLRFSRRWRCWLWPFALLHRVRCDGLRKLKSAKYMLLLIKKRHHCFWASLIQLDEFPQITRKGPLLLVVHRTGTRFKTKTIKEINLKRNYSMKLTITDMLQKYLFRCFKAGVLNPRSAVLLQLAYVVCGARVHVCSVLSFCKKYMFVWW